ncbi:hypothetical protein Plhal304r1_c019g0068771 [Plasmopara halstedii]
MKRPTWLGANQNRRMLFVAAFSNRSTMPVCGLVIVFTPQNCEEQICLASRLAEHPAIEGCGFSDVGRSEKGIATRCRLCITPETHLNVSRHERHFEVCTAVSSNRETSSITVSGLLNIVFRYQAEEYLGKLVNQMVIQSIELEIDHAICDCDIARSVRVPLD